MAAVSVIGVLAATATSQSRDSVLRGLEHRALPAAAATRTTRAVRLVAGKALVRTGSQIAVVDMTPNRAGAQNRLSVTLTRRGGPWAGAGVSVTFGMPAMNMAAAFRTRLVGEGTGRYGIDVPVLGMVGVWQLRVRVTGPGGRTAGAFTVADQMAP